MGDYLELAGRRLPRVALLCPVPDGGTDELNFRLLGCATGELATAYVPAENGVIFSVERNSNRTGWTIHLYTLACELDPWPAGDSPIYLMRSVILVDGRLEPMPTGRLPVTGDWYWEDAEDEWVLEHIDRLSVLPFQQPPGPAAQMVSFTEYRQRLEDEGR